MTTTHAPQARGVAGARPAPRHAERRGDTPPPEERLLLLCAGSAAGDGAIRDAAYRVADWNRFLGLAQVERAVPVIHPRLRDVASDVVPAGVLEGMRRLAAVSDFAMLHLESRLRESLQALARAGVRVMLIKGAALAHTVYAGARQRPMADVDVLVDPGNARIARRILLESGWREIAGVADAAYDHHHHLPPLHDARSPDLRLEIHTALFPDPQPFAFDAGDLWPSATPLAGSAPGAYAPSLEHSLLHACLHFVWSHQARFGVWRTVRDIDAISRSESFDWPRLVATARAARGDTSSYWALRIAHVTAGVAPPEGALHALRPPRRSSVLALIERHLLMNLFPAGAACPSVTLDHALWELAVMPRRSGHGRIRPWHADGAFTGSRAVPAEQRASARARRVRRLLASPGYIRTLLRSTG